LNQVCNQLLTGCSSETHTVGCHKKAGRNNRLAFLCAFFCETSEDGYPFDLRHRLDFCFGRRHLPFGFDESGAFFKGLEKNAALKEYSSLMLSGGFE